MGALTLHEHAIIRSVIDSILGELGSRQVRVKAVSLRVGALELHGEESFRQIFEVEAQATPLAGARLDLSVIAARIRCECGHEGPAGQGLDHHADLPVAECPACGRLCRVEGGRGVSGINLEIEEPVQ